MNLLNNIPLLNLITWMMLGALAGGLVHIVDGRDSQRNLWAAIIMGSLGGVAGGMLASYIFGSSLEEFNLSAAVIATAAAILLALAQRIVNLSPSDPNEFDYPNLDSNLATYSEIRPPQKSNTTQQLDSIVNDVKYPISKSDLLTIAEHKDIKSSTLSALEKLPDEIYHSKQELRQHLYL